MQREQMSLRNFKGGSWDLRKDDRRRGSQSIPFPDRRAADRRNASSPTRTVDDDALHWVTKPSLDE